MIDMSEEIIDNRCVKEAFWKELLEGGALSNFLEKVKDPDSQLQLRFRGNAKPQAITIYYNNHMVWRISKLCNGYKVEVSANHARGSKKKELLDKLRDEPLCFTTQSKNAQAYPYAKGTSFDKKFVYRTYKLMTDAIDEFFGKNKYLEKRRQQEIFEYLNNSDDGLYAYDLEFSQRYKSQEEKKAAGKQNEPDVLAVRYTNREPKSLVLIEIKTTEASCIDGKSGIKPHLEGMLEYIKDTQHNYMQNRKIEACDLIKTYKALGLHKPVAVVPKSDDITKYELMLIVTDDAIKYYDNNHEDIESYIEDICKDIYCEVCTWDKGKLFPRYVNE